MFRPALRALGAATLSLVLVWGANARAQDSLSEGDAERLFHEGKQLIEQGKVTEACEKFAASRNLVPRTGVLINLAQCYERAGAVASAVAAYREARIGAFRLAGATNTDDATRKLASEAEDFAKEQIVALEPKVAYLLIAPSAALPKGTTIALDGRIIGEHPLRAPIAADPGDHTVTFSAKGKQPAKINVKVDALAQEVTVPALEDLPADAPVVVAPVIQAPPPDPPTGKRTAGLALGGLGLVGLSVGASFGVLALTRATVAQNHCPEPAGTVCPDGTGLMAESDGKTFGHVSEVGFAVGIVGIAAGVYLVLSSSKVNAPTSTGARVPWPLRF